VSQGNVRTQSQILTKMRSPSLAEKPGSKLAHRSGQREQLVANISELLRERFVLDLRGRPDHADVAAARVALDRRDGGARRIPVGAITDPRKRVRADNSRHLLSEYVDVRDYQTDIDGTGVA